MGFINVGHGLNSHKFRVCKPRNKRSGASVKRHQYVTGLPSPELIASPEPEKPLLILDLPPEILYRVYCYAGFGSQNSLASTCVFLRDLFEISDNLWFLDLLIKTNFLVHLNENIRASRWNLKFKARFDLLPVHVQQSGVLNRLYHRPHEVIETDLAIDTSIFLSRCIDRDQLEFIRRRFDVIVTNKKSTTQELELRLRYVEWRYMVFRKFASLLDDPSDGEPNLEELAEIAENCEGVKSFKKKYSLDSYCPLVTSVSIPHAMYSAVTLPKLRKILYLYSAFEMNIANPHELLLKAVSSPDVIRLETLQPLLDLVQSSDANETEALHVLNSFRLLWQRQINTSSNAGLVVPDNDLSERLFELSKAVLTTFLSRENKPDIGAVWDVLKDLKLPELLDHVLKLGARPSI